LAQAQQDYSALTQNFISHRISSALSQDFRALGEAFHSGNLSAAQQAYSAIQQALQQLGSNLACSNAAQPTGNRINTTA
jgi:hypothetical protein